MTCIKLWGKKTNSQSGEWEFRQRKGDRGTVRTKHLHRDVTERIKIQLSLS